MSDDRATSSGGEIVFYEGDPGEARVDWLITLGNIELTIFSELLYYSRQEITAHLLFFVVKDHLFLDGNKHLGSLQFLLYLKQEGIVHWINPQALTALTLLFAESPPVGNDLILRHVINFLVEPTR